MRENHAICVRVGNPVVNGLFMSEINVIEIEIIESEPLNLNIELRIPYYINNYI